MFYVGYAVGSIFSICCWGLGFYACQSLSSGRGVELPHIPFIGRKAKKKPTSVSEYDQWKKEQNELPADPS